MLKGQTYVLGSKRLVWVFYNRENRDDDNETGLKVGRGIEMSTTLLSIFVFLLTGSTFVVFTSSWTIH